MAFEAQNELLDLSERLRKIELGPNPRHMIIGHSRKVNSLNIPRKLELNGSGVKRVEKIKSLGVTVDDNLEWDENYKVVKGKFAKGLRH